MRLTKIYTKIGDKGTTMLATGAMVDKDCVRIEAYGTVDELNSWVGLLRDSLLDTGSPDVTQLVQSLLKVQNELFDVGGELSVPAEVLDTSRQQVVGPEAILRLEREIDEWNETLEPLKNFVLPGGHRANSVAHLARTVCRRAERRVVAMARTEVVRDDVRIYLNRLSDWLFVVSRILSKTFGALEILWKQKGKN
jgi:cob(I)alamin adenosyltransferase